MKTLKTTLGGLAAIVFLLMIAAGFANVLGASDNPQKWLSGTFQIIVGGLGMILGWIFDLFPQRNTKTQRTSSRP